MQNHRTNVVEPLESRRLLSSAVLAGGTLVVLGEGTTTNTINVNFTSDHSQVEVDVTQTSSRGVSRSLQKFFPSRSVTDIYVRGGAKADAINVGTDNGMFNINTRIDALAGNDAVNVGDQNAVVNAGAGDDVVVCGDGNNLVRGQAGADDLTVGDGSNKVDGGAGDDAIAAGAGTNTLVGGAGDDTIVAADVAGNAVLAYGGQGNDTVTIGDGNDTVWGGVGDDVVTAGNGDDTFGCIVGHNTVHAGAGHNTYYARALALNTLADYDAGKDTLVTTPSVNDTLNLTL